MVKKTLILVLAGTIAYLAFGWVVFDLLLGAYTEKNTTAIAGFKKTPEQFITSFLVLSCAAYAALIVFVLVHLAKTRNVARGAAISAVIGILVAVMTDSYWFASSNFYNNVLVPIADVAGAAISVGFLGAVVTYLSNKIGDGA